MMLTEFKCKYSIFDAIFLKLINFKNICLTSSSFRYIISNVALLLSNFQFCNYPKKEAFHLLKYRDLSETNELYQLMIHPTVFPYVRHKVNSDEEYLFITKQLLEEEQLGKTISRTITDDWGQPIGTITLYDIQDGAGFLGTWIGVPFQGKGYNQAAKHEFLKRALFEKDIHTVFLRIRKENEKSKRAAQNYRT